METFEVLLQEAVDRHGHLCAGQVIGVRMAMLGCRKIGIDAPRSEKWRKKIMVFVEIDRCATDAVQSVTGCRLGKRTMKFKDFGINAATFWNLENQVAYRIVSTEESRKEAAKYAPEESSLKRQQISGYMRMPDDLLFNVERVNINVPEWEMPGKATFYATCERCGQVIRDHREVTTENAVLCRHCAGKGYFVMWNSEITETDNHSY